jgi:peptidoglycan/xylan/chitin deacetylase (PgdA/CDA1 family)
MTEMNGPARDIVGYGANPPRVVWPNDAKIAVNLVMNYEEGAEYSFPAGDNRNDGGGEVPPPPSISDHRDLAVESVFEYGSRAGIWRLMRLFDELDIKVTFGACAVALELNPEVGERLRAAGHEAACHGWRWEEPWRLTREEEKEHIRLAVQSIESICGERPLGWYCRYGPSVNTRELLVEEGGFVYDSDSFSDDLPYFTTVLDKQHLVLPYSFNYNDGKYMSAGGQGTPSEFAESCRRGFDELWNEGAAGHPKMMSIGLHARWIGQANRLAGLRDFLEYAREKGDVWFARRIDIARWWHDHHDEFSRS